MIISKFDELEKTKDGAKSNPRRKIPFRTPETLSDINRFRSVRFVNNSTQEVDEEDSSSSEDELTPGDDIQHDRQHRKTLVFSTSMTRDIDYVEFNKCYENGHARFQKWHGGRANHIKEYVVSHMKEEKPDTVIIHAGGNDLRTTRNNPTSTSSVANNIIDIGSACKKHGAARVVISGVITRKPKFLQERCKEVNELLESMCKLYNFTYIDNSGIGLDYLRSDGVHLNEEGTVLLANNYLKCLRKF